MNYPSTLSIRLVCLGICATIGFVNPLAAEELKTLSLEETFRSEKLAAIDAAVERTIADSKMYGAALWLEHEGVAYHKAYGQRSGGPDGVPMTEDTIFDLASVTKVVAAASAAKLCLDRGLIGIDDFVSKYLPEFTGEGREKVTIRHLLLHTAGLPLNMNWREKPFGTPADALAQACRTVPSSEPGSSYAYSSVGTQVLGFVVERVTGRAFDEFCTTEIYTPLGMHDTVFRPSGDRLSRVAPSSSPVPGLVDDKVARDIGGVAAHASLFSTTADLARFARMMLNLGELDGVRVFQPETIKLFTSVQSPAGLTSPPTGDRLVRRGLGWDINTPYRTPPHPYSLARGTVFPIGSYGHNGWTGQTLWIDPFSKSFVIFLASRYVKGVPDTRSAVYSLHHEVSTLFGEAIKNFDFENVPGALPPPPVVP